MNKLFDLLCNPETVAYTHAGMFHADDVFATALIKMINPSIKICRVFNVPDNAEFAYDIGGGKYDHHQQDAEVRENGVPYASFGLLWRELGKEICIWPESVSYFG